MSRSSETSWPTSLGLSKDESVIKPTFQQPEYFRESISVYGGWYCVPCTPPLQTRLHTVTAAKAMEHENSQEHKDKIEDMKTWRLPADAWGLALHNKWGIVEGEWGVVSDWGVSGTCEQLRSSDLGKTVPLKKRVKRWIRDMARADGIPYECDEDLDNDETDEPWREWEDDEDESDRKRGKWDPPEEEERDPRAIAEFRFVEKIAKKHGLDRNRLHVFYRLPTDEKLKRIKSIVNFLQSH